MAELTQEHFGEYMDSFAKMVKEGFDATATKAELKKVQATMVTKDYLDEKMADLRGDLVVLMRKEDTKLKKLIEKLRARNVLSDTDVQEIVRMEPFAALQP